SRTCLTHLTRSAEAFALRSRTTCFMNDATHPGCVRQPSPECPPVGCRFSERRDAFALVVEGLHGPELLQGVTDPRRIADGHDLHPPGVQIRPRRRLHLLPGHPRHAIGISVPVMG